MIIVEVEVPTAHHAGLCPVNALQQVIPRANQWHVRAVDAHCGGVADVSHAVPHSVQVARATGCDGHWRDGRAQDIYLPAATADRWQTVAKVECYVLLPLSA